MTDRRLKTALMDTHGPLKDEKAQPANEGYLKEGTE